MTTEDAIKLLEYPLYKWSMDCDERDDGLSYTEVIELAIDALRAQQEAEKNAPLTLDELREMVGEPYWHVGLQEDSPPPHWSILDANFAQHIEDYKYGERWLAFRRKPKGD